MCICSRLLLRGYVHRIIVLALVITVLLTSVTLGEGITLGVAEKSWSTTFAVPAMNSIALRGVIRLPNTQVNGSFTVRSCCGYSTNDINFNIANVDFSGSKDYGVVVDSLSFSWNTRTSEEYETIFDNKWGQICDQNGCHPDPSNPSSHNKTIELNVREVAPATFSSLFTASNIIIGVAVVVGIGLALSVIVILRQRRTRKRQNPES